MTSPVGKTDPKKRSAIKSGVVSLLSARASLLHRLFKGVRTPGASHVTRRKIAAAPVQYGHQAVPRQTW